MLAARFSLICAGVFFAVGLLTGTWKYGWIRRSPDARAPVYVDIAHRASLLYAFACALLSQFCAGSAWSNTVNLIASAVLVLFFGVSVLGYIVHGVLRDTDNQLSRPHRLGNATIPDGLMTSFMFTLVAAEFGAFGVVFAGYIVGPR